MGPLELEFNQPFNVSNIQLHKMIATLKASLSCCFDYSMIGEKINIFLFSLFSLFIITLSRKVFNATILIFPKLVGRL